MAFRVRVLSIQWRGTGGNISICQGPIHLFFCLSPNITNNKNVLSALFIYNNDKKIKLKKVLLDLLQCINSNKY